VPIRERADEQIHQTQRRESPGALTGGIGPGFNTVSAVVLDALEPARRRLRSVRDDAGALLDYLPETALARRRRQLASSPCPRSQLVAPWLRDLPNLVCRSGRGLAVCVARRYAGLNLA